MNQKRNYILYAGILLFLLFVTFVVIFLHPVEYLHERIMRELIQTDEDIIPESDIPEDYYSQNQYMIDIEHYDVTIEMEENNESISGIVVVTGRFITKELSEIDLNFYDNMSISSLKLNGKIADYDHDETRLNIPIEDKKSENFSLEIAYSGKPLSLYFGSFNIMDYFGTPVVYTINEPIFASSWLPCNDLPSDKAMFDIHIKADSSLTSVSNGKFVDRIISGKKAITSWKTLYPMSTYLLTINIGNYVQIKDSCKIASGNLDLEYFVFPDQVESAKSDFENHCQYINFFSDKFGEYPFIDEKYGIVEILWMSGAIENQTLTGLGSPFITGDKYYEDLYIHELAHHWFGDAVTPQSWEDVWLNEGFATYCEALFFEHRGGKQALTEFLFKKFDYFDKSKLYNPGIDLFNRLVYDKGAWVLHMLRNELGDELFFNILRNYYESYKYKNASTFDFKNVCEKISGDNLDKFFDQWVFQGKGIIEAQYEIINQNEGSCVKLSQIQTGYDTYNFPLEVEINRMNSRETLSFFINSADTLLRLGDEPVVNIILDPESKLLAEFTQKTAGK